MCTVGARENSQKIPYPNQLDGERQLLENSQEIPYLNQLDGERQLLDGGGEVL